MGRPGQFCDLVAGCKRAGPARCYRHGGKPIFPLAWKPMSSPPWKAIFPLACGKPIFSPAWKPVFLLVWKPIFSRRGVGSYFFRRRGRTQCFRRRACPRVLCVLGA